MKRTIRQFLTDTLVFRFFRYKKPVKLLKSIPTWFVFKNNTGIISFSRLLGTDWLQKFLLVFVADVGFWVLNPAEDKKMMRWLKQWCVVSPVLLSTTIRSKSTITTSIIIVQLRVSLLDIQFTILCSGFCDRKFLIHIDAS